MPTEELLRKADGYGYGHFLDLLKKSSNRQSSAGMIFFLACATTKRTIRSLFPWSNNVE